MFGLLNVNKPFGVTSRDVVNQVQRLVRPVKVGHAGTLDPLATGVLVLCLGQATRLVPYIQRMPKRYRGTFLLGHESDTEDVEGDVTELPDAPRPSRGEIEQVLPGFLGTILQRPPSFSALKINGKRAYELARSGQGVKMASRPVTIHQLELVAFDYPELTLEILCGSGTYVRSVGRDVAEALGTAGVMSGLVRLEIGPFSEGEAISPQEFTRSNVASYVLPPRMALMELQQVQLNSGEMERVRRGLSIPDRFGQERDELAAVNAAGDVVAILVPRGGGWGPVRNFSDES